MSLSGFQKGPESRTSTQAAVAKVGKDRLRYKKAPFAHFRPMAVAITVTKTGALQLIMRLADEDEEALRLPSGAKARTKLVLGALVPGVVKDLLVVTTLRGYEHLATQNLSPKRAGQLISDSGAVARAKYEKTGSRLQAAVSMFPSAFRGAILVNLAVFTVEELVLVIQATKRAIRSRRESKSKSKSKSKPNAGSASAPDGDETSLALQEPGFWSESLDRLVRCMGSVGFEGLGATLGTLIFPGTGTVVLQTIGSLVCWLI